MIRIRSGLAPVSTENGKSEEQETEIKDHKSSSTIKMSPSKRNITHTKEKVVNISSSSKEHPLKKVKLEAKKESTSGDKRKPFISKDLPPIERQITKPLAANLAWTEKYKPKDLKSVIGQQGEKSNMNKLLNWLRNWHKYHSGIDKPKLSKPSPWAKDDDGAYYKCALLSGPPGVGNIPEYYSFYSYVNNKK